VDERWADYDVVITTNEGASIVGQVRAIDVGAAYGHGMTVYGHLLGSGAVLSVRKRATRLPGGRSSFNLILHDWFDAAREIIGAREAAQLRPRLDLVRRLSDIFAWYEGRDIRVGDIWLHPTHIHDLFTNHLSVLDRNVDPIVVELSEHRKGGMLSGHLFGEALHLKRRLHHY
jgi:hypothetical protein